MKYIFTFLLIILSISLQAQSADRSFWVKGTVTDHQGEPLIGVTVAIKGTLIGTITHLDGDYKLKVNTSDVLVFSFFGFTTQEIACNGKSKIDVTLKEKYDISSYPVEIYSESQRKADLSAASVTYTVEDIDSRAAGFNSELFFNGLVSGFYLQNMGNVFQPQAAIQSGIGNVGGEARQVVNGVADAPYNLADVETLEVVKGAPSAINYTWADAPGGVLNIGLNPYSYDISPKITFNAWTGVQTATALFPYNDKKMFGNYLNDAFVQHYDAKFNAYQSSLSISGFVGYDDIKGTIKGSDAKRFTPRLTVGYNKQHMSFSQTVYYDYREQEHNWLYRYNSPILGSGGSSIDKDVVIIKDNPYKELFSVSKLFYSPVNWLRAQTLFSYDWVDTKGSRATNNGYYVSYRDYYDLRNQENSTNNRWMWDTSVSGRNIFYNFSYTAGFIREYTNLHTTLLSNAMTYKPEWKRSKAVSTLFAKVDYNYNSGQRAAAASIKQVSSSILDKNNKTVYLPTVSASWKFSEESFLYDMNGSTLSFAKLKAGWGKTANTGVYIPVTNLDGNGYPDFNFENLKWQVTSKFDGGVSFGFFETKLYLDAEYYHKTTNHIFINEAVGQPTMQIASSNAKIENKGWNFTASLNNLNDIKSYYLVWSLRTNLSINKSSVINNENKAPLLIQNYIAPKYMYGGGGEVTYRNLNFKFNVAAVSDLYLQASAFTQNHLVKVHYVSLKSLYLAYSKRKFLGFRNNVIVYAHAENILLKTNSAVKNPGNTDFVQYPVNRMFNVGVKLTLK